MPAFSAYMSIYEDYDILPAALRSLRGRVSELVVVDGAYEWMASYLTAIGKNPEQSSARQLEIIKASGLNYRILTGLWRNEVEKRMAGYSACSADYIFRADADEVSFFDDAAIETFISGGHAVGQMDMPMYDSPGLILTDGTLQRQGFLFDRKQVSAQQHCHHLWLVLTADMLANFAEPRCAVFDTPVAFNAHLSNWRTPAGSSQRAAFYVMNYMRAHGFGACPLYRDKAVSDFTPFFELITPREFASALKRSLVTSGQFDLKGMRLAASPLTAAQEDCFVGCYDAFLAGAREANVEAIEAPQAFIAGEPVCFHLPRGALASPVEIEFSCALASVQVSLRTVTSVTPFERKDSVPYTLSGTSLILDLSGLLTSDTDVVRRVLQVVASPVDPQWYGSYLIKKWLD